MAPGRGLERHKLEITDKLSARPSQRDKGGMMSASLLLAMRGQITDASIMNTLKTQDHVNRARGKPKSAILLWVAVAAIFYGLVGSLQAVPPPPSTVPDSGSTGILLVLTLGGLSWLRAKKRI